MIKKVSNIGIRVKDAGAAAEIFSKAFGLSKIWDKPAPENGQTRNVLLRISQDTTLELCEPNETSSMRKRLDKYGEGLSHMTIVVDNLDKTIKEIESMGIKTHKELTDAEKKLFSAFPDPRGTCGVLIEIITDKEATAWSK